MISLLGVDDFAAMEPAGRNFNGSDQRAPLRMALTRWGQYGPDQTAGRFYPVACVALEITQRCNLDCTLCYLSDAAEIVHDVPLDVLLSRVDMIYSHYGPLTSIQITGGEPSLRKVEDLEKLCRYISESGMRSCLMTNGIKASAQLLGRLARAGLDDVAFHVDLTQKRKGYPTEASLNELRREYIERAKGLKLRILFNTTIFGGNINEVPALSRFFRAKAAEITLASFQLQADTGRGVLRERDNTVTPDSVIALISDGIQAQLHFDTTAVGHPACTRYCSILVAGDQAVSALSDRSLLRNVLGALEASECRIGAYLDFTPAVWTGDTRDTRPIADLRWIDLRLVNKEWKTDLCPTLCWAASCHDRPLPPETLNGFGEGIQHTFSCLAAKPLDSLVGSPDSVGDEAEVRERGPIAIALRDLRRCRRVANHRDFETLLQQLA